MLSTLRNCFLRLKTPLESLRIMKNIFSSPSRAGSVIDISTTSKIHQFLAVTSILYSEEIDFTMVKIQHSPV